MSSANARYSQPIEPEQREVDRKVTYAGFVYGEPGFIVRDARVKEPMRVPATRANMADEQPKGFFHALAKLFGGRP